MSLLRRNPGTEYRAGNKRARLAAILPVPLKQRPERMNCYSAIILKRMDQMGW